MTKILCIEDETTIRMLVAEALGEAGHQVIEAADGADGLRNILRHEPDLVICDSLMPAMTGVELFEELRNRHPRFAAMPFIFLSAHTDRSKIDDGLALGVTAYLTKPIDLDLLIRTVERALGDRS